jgi:hypothetical protein
VVRLTCDELVSGVDARQSKDVKAARRSLTISAERRPTGDHRLREPVHVRPMRLEQLVVIPKRCRSGRVAAVDEEVQRAPQPRRGMRAPRPAVTGDAPHGGRPANRDYREAARRRPLGRLPGVLDSRTVLAKRPPARRWAASTARAMRPSRRSRSRCSGLSMVVSRTRVAAKSCMRPPRPIEGGLRAAPA